MIASIPDLVAFLKRYHRDWLEDPSLDLARIPADLPPGLAMVYRELGGLAELEGEDGKAPFSAQDHLVPVDRLKRIDGMIEFAWENQGNWSARFPAGPPDPPVYSNARDLWSPERRGFVVVCESLDHFLTTLCLQEAVMSSRDLVALRTDRPPDRVLTIPVRPLWVKGSYVDVEPDHDFFVTPDQGVIVMDWGGGLWVGSQFDDVASLVDSGIGVQEID